MYDDFSGDGTTYSFPNASDIQRSKEHPHLVFIICEFWNINFL